MHADIVLVGGGLANGLIAWRLTELRPDLSLLLLERDAEPGGNHTWSFHADDLSPAQRLWLDPFIVHRWPGQAVRFPGRTRVLSAGYSAVTSDRFAHLLRERLGDRLITGAAVTHLSADAVELDDGTVVRAGAVIDGRGGTASPHFLCGYQKFLGLELALSEPHGLTIPVIMDARVEQTDGYRFVYVLPLSEDRLLVEDTYYSDEPSRDPVALRERVLAYAAAQGWTVDRVVREETGVLPILMAGRLDAFLADGVEGVARSGLAGAFCHPVTGYSLPDAARVADLVASLPHPDGAALALAVQGYARRRWRGQGFLRLIARLLFMAARPHERRAVMERFYGLPEPLIARFYAGRPTMRDKLRTLSGRPPVPIRRAVPLIREASVLRHAGVLS